MQNSLIVIFAKVVLIVLFGFILKKTNIINNEFQKELSNFLLKAVLPVSILSSSSNLFSPQLSKGLATTAVVCLIYYILTLILAHVITKLFRINNSHNKIFITMSVFANVGFIGFPLAEQLYGNNGLLYTVVYNMFYQIFLFTYGINLLSDDKKTNLISIFKSPISLASFVTIAIYLSPYRFPKFISESMSAVGGMIVPLSMIIIGCTLVDMKPMEILKDKYAHFVTFIRLILFPAVVILLLQLLGVRGEVAIVIAILSSLPSGSLNVILAQQYNCNPEYAARTVVETMTFMVLTLPIVLSVAIKLF
ncbi:AEC family transporter [Clostridium sp.]|jgi:predicted permease|uniref:AEC family transporter n=1 Tax=Clostridium sp. TaxID=1506 RepID=UPI0025BEC5E1|nr:AEC family transporter [Clostridium sp.]MCI1715615.1 AEC family transporter [Clostridium sp.]MCI1799593.1 AEC family transporter [Clostridium sp.]MCI1813799.1 AEC family transporter [Clostridium sp.]MCI2202919.1 AEC family transporter [Clostridium sp.]